MIVSDVIQATGKFQNYVLLGPQDYLLYNLIFKLWFCWNKEEEKGWFAKPLSTKCNQQRKGKPSSKIKLWRRHVTASLVHQTHFFTRHIYPSEFLSRIFSFTFWCFVYILTANSFYCQLLCNAQISQSECCLWYIDGTAWLPHKCLGKKF